VAEASATVLWSPQEGPQTLLLSCPVFEIFYGGARGGGKTESSIGDWLQHSNEWGEHAIGIFFRRKLVQLAEVIARTKVLFPKLGAKYNEQQKTWTMANGARLKFAYLERDSDAEEYQGHSYTRIYIEELTNFPMPGPIDKLRATLRSAIAPTGMRLTGNPGGPGHNWVKARYIDPAPKGFKIITESTDVEIDGVKRTVSLDRVFIPSKLGDNQLLMRGDPTYVLRLRQSGSEQLVKAWLDGNWDVVDGAFFDCWDETKHVLRTSEWLKRIPKSCQIFRAFDWGSARPFSVGWYAHSDGSWGLPKGALLKFHEWYGASGPNKGLKMTADMVALGIRERELTLFREHSLTCSSGVADPAIYIRDGGPSIGETMAVKGVTWRRADNKRKAGAEQVRQRLVGDGTTPMLYFLDCCEDTIRTLPTLQHDSIDAEDVDTESEDHAYDETRYACMSRPWLKTPSVEPTCGLPKLPGEHTINQLVERLRQKRLSAMET
jgi:hypothetical protein